MDGIQLTLKNLTLAQMVLGWLFVACYAVTVGGMLGNTGRWRSGASAALSAVAFAALCDNWVHGALLTLFAVGGMALFVMASWLLSHGLAWLLHRGEREPSSANPQVANAKPARVSGVLNMLRRLGLALD